MARGGSRVGAGRKKVDPQAKRTILLDELLFPAVCSALNAEPGVWKDGYLQVEISKTQIKQAYGQEGLNEWQSYFTLKKIGGRNRFGQGYKTTWSFNLNKYGFIVKLIESLGHNIKSIPNIGFPPQAMLNRLNEIAARKEAKELRAKMKETHAKTN